jgi:hypothetical protein
MARCRSQGRSSSSCCGSAGTWRLRTDHCLARDCPPRHPCSCEAWRPPPQRRSCRQRRAQPREPSFCAALIAGRSLHPSPACHRWRWARTAASQPPSSASCSLGLRSNNPASPSSSSVCEKCEAVKAAALCVDFGGRVDRNEQRKSELQSRRTISIRAGHAHLRAGRALQRLQGGHRQSRWPRGGGRKHGAQAVATRQAPEYKKVPKSSGRRPPKCE